MLAASDLGVGLIVQSINIAIIIKLLAVIEGDGGEGDHALYLIRPLVKTWQFFTIFFAGASLLTIGASSVNRNLAMSLHVTNHELTTPARVFIVTAAIWVRAFLSARLQTLITLTTLSTHLV